MPTTISQLGAKGRQALILACGFLLLISAAGGLSFHADSVNVFALYWLPVAIVVLAATIWIDRRRRRGSRTVRWAPALLLIGFVGLGSVLLEPLVGAARPAATGRSFRLVSFNMNKANPDPERVADWLLAQRADFVVLLEVSPANRIRIRDRLRARFPHAYDCARSGRCSTYILSRLPAEDDWPLAQGDADNRRALSALTARFRIGGALVPITAVHLDRPWPWGGQHRELAALDAAVAAVGREGIVAGDFNSAPWTFSTRRIAAAGGVALVSGATATWPTTAPLRLPLDQVYAGPCLAASAVTRGPALGSDHFPLIVDFNAEACRG